MGLSMGLPHTDFCQEAIMYPDTNDTSIKDSSGSRRLTHTENFMCTKGTLVIYFATNKKRKSSDHSHLTSGGSTVHLVGGYEVTTQLRMSFSDK